MTKLLISAALGAVLSIAVAAPASAQAVAPAKVAVADLDRITQECNACKTAGAALQQQMSTLQARATQLQNTLKPEQTYLEGAVNALAGKEPDAALKTRIGNFQRSQQSAAQEIQTQQNQIQRNQAYIRQQLLEKLNSLYTGVMTRRGANMLVEMSSTLAYDPSLDVTADLLAALNAALPSLNTVAPAPAAPAAGTQPSGR